MWRRLVLLSITGAAAAAGACRTRPLALGEALVVVTTDAAIPKHVGHLRIDVYRDDGTLLETRDIVAPRPEDWPISFGVVADREEMRTATVRLRAYAEGHLIPHADAIRDGGTEPISATSLEEACASAPTLELGTPLTARRGDKPITSVLPYATDAGSTCTEKTAAGSIVAKVVVAEADRYRFSVTRATPNGALGLAGGDTTLALRAECSFPTSQIVCNDDVDSGPDGGNRLSAFDRVLDAGTYWLVTGGAEPASADLTLLAVRGDAGENPAPAAAVVTDADRLEPNAAITIDRLVQVELVPGYRGTVPIVLRGECFGTPADLASGETCLDTSAARVAAPPVVADGDLKRSAPVPPAWAAEVDDPCSVAPRPPSALHDDEVCVPGGAFLMGDALDLTDLDFRSRPEHVRAVPAFLLDRFEFTVGRYRAAVAAGFVERKSDPFVGDPNGKGKACTYVGKNRPDHDAFPLSCVTFATARALCNFEGRELPTEDQWEYAASAAGRPFETQYPWGDALPDCSRTAVERSDITATECATELGPVPVDRFGDATTGDVTALGIHGLGGNVQEWLLTGFFPYDRVVWKEAGLRRPLDPVVNAEAPLQATRGGDWSSFVLFATASARRALPPLGQYDNAGFRCARAGH